MIGLLKHGKAEVLQSLLFFKNKSIVVTNTYIGTRNLKFKHTGQAQVS